MPDRPLIVCALEFERRAMSRAGLDQLADLHCCGPGAPGIHQWAAKITAGPRLVILCGLAGALRPHMQSGTAHVIHQVCDESGSSWTSPAAAQPAAARCTVLSTANVITSAAEKAALAERFNVDLVDLESAAFAHEAQQRNWNWQIVRGVSDGADESLPPDIAQWVDARGRSRTAAIALRLLRQPSLVQTLRRLHRNSFKAMDAVANLVGAMLKRETRAR